MEPRALSDRVKYVVQWQNKRGAVNNLTGDHARRWITI